MRKGLRFIFLVKLLFLLSINSAWAAGIKEKIISQETAFEKIAESPEMRFLKKYYEGEDYYWSSFTQQLPDEVSPEFNIRCVIYKGEKWGEKVFSEIFYVNAYTGEVRFDEAARQNLSAMMEAEKTRRKAETEDIKKEKTLKEELDKVYSEINQKRSLDKNEYDNFVRESIPLFLRALNAVTPEIRSQALNIIGQLANYSEGIGGYKIKQAIPRLLELLRDKDYGLRYGALFALGNIGDKGDKILIDAVLLLSMDRDSLVRRGAIEALGKLGDSSLTPVLVGLLDESAVNQDAVKTLAKIGDQRAIEPLADLFNKKDYFYLERDIIYAIGNIGDERGIPFLIKLLNKEYTPDIKYGGNFNPPWPYMGPDAAVALVKIGKGAIPYLAEALKSADYLIRLYAVYALDLMKNISALGYLEQMLVTEENPTVRLYVEQAIAGIKGQKFIPLQKKIEVRAESPKKRYNRTDAITLFLYLENKEPFPLVINTAPTKFSDLSFDITGPDNERIFSLIEYSRSLFPAKADLVILKPGETYKAGPFLLKEDYNFTKPGKYRITGRYENNFSGIEFGVYAWVGKIESLPVTVELN